MEEFREWWWARTFADLASGEDKVQVMTVHAAKGKEWPAVVMTECTHGAFSDSEDLRLFFVGCTRAQDTLVLTYSTRGGHGGREFAAKPSPFLAMAGIQPTHGRPSKWGGWLPKGWT